MPIDGAWRVAPAHAGGEVSHHDWHSRSSHSSNPVRSGVRIGKAGTGALKRTAVQGLEAWLSRELGEPARIESAEQVGGGTGREIWKVAVTNAHHGKPHRLLRLVRGETSPGSETGLSRAGEFAVLRAAQEAGLLVPRPLLLCEDTDVFGASFFITQFVRAKGEYGIGRSELGRTGTGYSHSCEPPPEGLANLPCSGSGLPESRYRRAMGPGDRQAAPNHAATGPPSCPE